MSNLQDDLNEALSRVFAFKSVEAYKDYQERLRRHRELIERLQDDWDFATGETDVLDEIDESAYEQFCRRTIVRTLFAMVEGAVFALKQEVLEQHRIGRLELSPAEYAILSEEAYTLKESGTLSVSNFYPKLKANIKFTFPIYARAWGVLFEFDPSLDKEPRWGDFCRAIDIRNHLMHPKTLEDLTVSESDLETVLSAADWFQQQLDRLDQIITLEAMMRTPSQAQIGEAGDTAYTE